MPYDLILAVNFSKFSKNNFENDIFKFVGETELDEWTIPYYKHGGLLHENPWVGMYQYEENKEARPLFFGETAKYSKTLPVINLTCPLTKTNPYFQEYLAILRKSINDNVTPLAKIKRIKLFICGHGKSINTLGTGGKELNNGSVTYEDVLAVLDDLLLSHVKLSQLKLHLVSCTAANKNSHDYLFKLLCKKQYDFPFSVVAYRKNITLGDALVSSEVDHQEERSSAEYSKIDGISSGMEILKKEFTKKILPNYKNSSILEIVSQSHKDCDNKYNIRFLDTLADRLIGKINDIECTSIPKCNNVLVKNKAIDEKSEKMLSEAQVLLQNTMKFKKAFVDHIQTKVLLPRETFKTAFSGDHHYSKSDKNIAKLDN